MPSFILEMKKNLRIEKFGGGGQNVGGSHFPLKNTVKPINTIKIRKIHF